MEKATFVILGATGDLTKRKLLPAIYHLVKKRKLKDFAVIGASRSSTTMDALIKSSKKFVKGSKKSVWNNIIKRSAYVKLDFNEAKDYKLLSEITEKMEKKYRLPGKRIFYFATLPDHFEVISDNLRKINICDKKNRWPRLAYEKPFGHDLQSAKKINSCVMRLFGEKQIYRIDHFLGKELVANIDLVRFTNRILEPLWCRDHLDSVQIVLNESLGVEGRGGYYDKYGAMKDMVQNHMLQLVSLIAMQSPDKLEGEGVRDRKVDILKNIKLEDVLLGQYEGYKKEKNVGRDSGRETFVALRLGVDHPRWKGVPFYLKTGKALKETKSVIYLKFKKVDCLLTKTCPSDTNYLIINLKSNEGMAFEINTKVPGEIAVTPTKLDFRTKNRYGPNTPEAYENLIEEVIKGNQYVFVRNDAIEYSWKAVDKIMKRKKKVFSYKKGSEGPKELVNWSKRNGVRWR